MAARTVTIVTPSYNQGRYIRATIESVLAQDYPRLEYLIMDGGSRDETAAVARDYTGRLTFVSEPDRGQSHAINKGFRRARGEIVAWLNSDDLLLPGAVSRAVAALESNPAAAAVYGEGYRLDAAGRQTGRFPATEPFNLWKLLYLSDYVLQQTLFFRKPAIEEVGYLDESLHYVMDWDILIRIARRRPLVYIPEYLGCLREYPEAKSFAGGKARIRELGAMLRRHTRRRYPPGYLAYALDDLQKRWLRALQRAPRAPRMAAGALVYGVTAYAIMRLLRDSQGWLPDGWASPRVHWMLPPGRGPVVIRGRIPEGEARLCGQELAVSAGKQALARAPIGPGEFRVEVPVASSDAPLALELRARRWYRAPFAERGTVRRRAYLLESVAWAEEHSAGAGEG